MSEVLQALAHLRRDDASERDIDAIQEFAGVRLPVDFVTLYEQFDGTEGWVGDSYVAFWPAAELIANNRTLDVEHIAPGLLLFATDGGGEAYALDTKEDSRVVTVPLVGLSRDLAIAVGRNVTEWLTNLSRLRTQSQTDHSEARMNVYDVQPVILGGDGTDPGNKVWVSLSQLLEIARWWNERLRRLR